MFFEEFEGCVVFDVGEFFVVGVECDGGGVDGFFDEFGGFVFCGFGNEIENVVDFVVVVDGWGWVFDDFDVVG